MFDEKAVQLEHGLVLAKLKPLLEDASVLNIGHNLKYDATILGRLGIAITPFDDTILMSFDLDAGLHGHGMDELAATHLSHTRSEAHTSELQSLMRISYAVFCLKKQTSLNKKIAPTETVHTACKIKSTLLTNT